MQKDFPNTLCETTSSQKQAERLKREITSAVDRMAKTLPPTGQISWLNTDLNRRGCRL